MRTKRSALPASSALSCAVALLMLSAPASADYWVSIGAFKEAATATEVAASASDLLSLPFATLAVDANGKGTLHRVAAGPMATREEANVATDRVRQAGYHDAWIIVLDDKVPQTDIKPAESAPVPQTELPASAPEAATIDTDAATIDTTATTIDTTSDTWNGELPPIEVLLQGLPDVPAAWPPQDRQPSPETDDEIEVETEIPEDYQLHRLRRDGAMHTLPHTPSPFGDLDTRIKWFTSALSLPEGDALRQATGNSTPMGHNADLRLMWRKNHGSMSLLLDHSTIWLRNESNAASPGLTFDQTPTDDGRRLFDLTWQLDADSRGEWLHRLDRLALQYRSQRWGVTVGRQAISWGGGLVFNPMDLFNPFAPTTVDQDYKAGDDLLLIEHLLKDGSDLQLLAVGRRALDGQADFDASSVAVKYRAIVGENELELMASQHFGSQVYGVGLRIPAGGALVRSDITWHMGDDDITVSGLINADYSIGVRGTIVHVFGEYFYNGFGVGRLPSDLSQLPPPLIDRIGRGELFNLMRSYLAIGTTFRWHYLLNQSLALIGNLHDHSFALQASLSYDASDASRLQAGFTKPFGNRGDEFGGVTVGEGLTVGGGEQAFLRFVFFF